MVIYRVLYTNRRLFQFDIRRVDNLREWSPEVAISLCFIIIINHTRVHFFYVSSDNLLHLRPAHSKPVLQKAFRSIDKICDITGQKRPKSYKKKPKVG